jgi:hypothetical protein
MTPPAASAAAAPAINPRRTVGPRRAPAAPRRPRRISGPASPARNPANNPSRSRARSQTRGWAAGPAHAVGLAEAVATHRLLDRLIRGRIWIGVIAFALIGIVTMQLGLLKLNAGIGRSLAQESLLQRENATLSTENSEIAAGERIEAQAERAGMELIPAGALHFLAVHPGADARKAAAAVSSSASAPGSVSAPSSTTTAEAEATSGAESALETTASTGAGSEATTADTASETEASASVAPAEATAGATEQSGTAPEATTPTSETAQAPVSGASTETSAGGAGEAAGSSPPITTGGGTGG